MIQIGDYQRLTIMREKPQGFYLEDKDGNEVLLPRAYITDDMDVDDEIEVFVYCDSMDLDVATTERPLITLDKFACLKVIEVNNIGAFVDWGLSKDLLIPYRNQKGKLFPGQKVIVYLYLDETSDLLVGTTKINRYLAMEADDNIVKGQEVDLLVYAETELGYKVIIDQKYAGLVYKNECPRPLDHGQELKGYIRPLRDDGKIDVSLFRLGHKSIEPNAQKIMDAVNRYKGILPFTDKSDPELIRKEFGMSKKLFKKALGLLYKQKLVLLKEDGIYKI